MFKMAESREISKIQCRSKRAITSIFDAINEHIEQIIAGNTESSPEEKKKCKLRFKEIYETALQQNVLIDGEEWSHADSQDETSEFEPVDGEKKLFISNELVPKLDTALVTVARKRKFHPRFCEEEVYEAINKNAFYLAKTEVTDDKTDNALSSPEQSVSLLGEPHLQPQVETTSSMLNKVLKNVTSSEEKAEQLETAVSIFQNPSETDKILLEGNATNLSSLNKNGIKVNINGTVKCKPRPHRHKDYIVQA